MNCLCGEELEYIGNLLMGDSVLFCYMCGTMMVTDRHQLREWHSAGGVMKQKYVGGKWIPDK